MTDHVGGWRRTYSGKVRDLYESAQHPELVLMVASDRVSAFDHVLEPGIPGKGELLTRLSLWWFAQLPDVPNHLVEPVEASAGDDAGEISTGSIHGISTGSIRGSSIRGSSTGSIRGIPIPAEFAGRAMLVQRLEMHPVECVVRGYLTGSGFKEYQATGSVCGVPLPGGLADGDRLPEPIFTPAFKAPLGEHDENITFERTVELVGADSATALRDVSLSIFSRASAIAEQHGVILADTKFEFGVHPATGQLVLADEVLTSDSSRYWDAAEYAAGNRGVSFDKQIVRDWLASHWDGTGEPPSLPGEIVARTAERYRELVERLTGAAGP